MFSYKFRVFKHLSQHSKFDISLPYMIENFDKFRTNNPNIISNSYFIDVHV